MAAIQEIPRGALRLPGIREKREDGKKEHHPLSRLSEN